MRHQYLTIKSLNAIDDGLGGYTESFVDIKVYGKFAYSKDKMVVTRANEVNTQKLVNMIVMYLNTNRNKESILQAIKKGDKFIYNNTSYSVHLVEAYQKIFIITFMEDYDVVDIPPVEEPEETPDGEVEDYWG